MRYYSSDWKPHYEKFSSTLPQSHPFLSESHSVFEKGPTYNQMHRDAFLAGWKAREEQEVKDKAALLDGIVERLQITIEPRKNWLKSFFKRG